MCRQWRAKKDQDDEEERRSNEEGYEKRDDARLKIQLDQAKGRMGTCRTVILLARLGCDFFETFFCALPFDGGDTAEDPVAGKQIATYRICRNPTGTRSVEREETGSATMDEKSMK